MGNKFFNNINNQDDMGNTNNSFGNNDNFKDLDDELEIAKSRNELSFIEAKCAIGARDDLGRPTTTAFENKENFKEYLKTLG